MKLSLRALKHLFSFFQSSLDYYRKRSTSITESDMSLRQQLSTLEKKMLQTQELVEIRGKVRHIPEVLIILHFLIGNLLFQNVAFICKYSETSLNRHILFNTFDTIVETSSENSYLITWVIEANLFTWVFICPLLDNYQ